MRRKQRTGPGCSLPEIVGVMEHQDHGGITTQAAFNGYIVPTSVDVPASYPQVSMCLNGGGQMRIDAESETLIAHALRADGFDASEDGTGRGTPLVAVHAVGIHGDVAHTLNAHQAGSVQEDGTGHGIPIIAFSAKDYGADADEIAPTLRSMGHDGSHANGGGQVAVAFQESQTGCRGHDPVGTRIREGMAVRRLTVIECSRLQGFPDTYLMSVPLNPRKIDAEEAEYYMSHGLECWRDGDRWMTRVPADGPMYKAYGNSMAVPVMRWIGERIDRCDAAKRRKG